MGGFAPGRACLVEFSVHGLRAPPALTLLAVAKGRLFRCPMALRATLRTPRDPREQFRALTGVVIAAPTTAALPSLFLQRPAPSPTEVLSGMRLSRRTTNALRRYLERGEEWPRWTYERLAAIDGIGFAAILEIVAGQRQAAIGRQLPQPLAEEAFRAELDRLLALRSGPADRLPTPLLDRAMDLVAANLPASEKQVIQRLVTRGLVRPTFDLALLERAARYRDVAPPFGVLRRRGMVVVVQATRLKEAERAYIACARALAIRGVASVAQIAAKAGIDDAEFAGKVLSTRVGFEWLHRRGGWFWINDQGASLVDEIEEWVPHGESIECRELARLLFGRWPAELSPPDSVVAAICRRRPQFRVSGTKIFRAPLAAAV